MKQNIKFFWLTTINWTFSIFIHFWVFFTEINRHMGLVFLLELTALWYPSWFVPNLFCDQTRIVRTFPLPYPYFTWVRSILSCTFQATDGWLGLLWIHFHGEFGLPWFGPRVISNTNHRLLQIWSVNFWRIWGQKRLEVGIGFRFWRRFNRGGFRFVFGSLFWFCKFIRPWLLRVCFFNIKDFS